jgi:hypothetical protein
VANQRRSQWSTKRTTVAASNWAAHAAEPGNLGDLARTCRVACTFYDGTASVAAIIERKIIVACFSAADGIAC